MAQGIDIERLKSLFLQCTICTLEYNENENHPRIFPCLHGACYTCVKKLVKNEKLICPNCRKEYVVPENSIEIFLKDNTRRDLLNFVQLQDSSVVICDNCNEDTEPKKHASYRCRVCAQFLCKECSNAHQKLKATKSHGLIDLEDLKNKTIAFEDFCLEGQCLIDGHNFSKLTLYCENKECQMPVCMTCAFCDHQSHCLRNIDNVFQEKKKALEMLVEDLDCVSVQQRGVITQIEYELRDLDTHVETAQNSIDKEFEDCRKIIEKRRQEHVVNLVEIKEKKYKIMQKHQEDIQSLLNMTLEGCEFAQQALRYRNPSAFLLIEKTISDRLGELKNTRYDTVPHQNSYISFNEQGIQDTVLQTAKYLGKLFWTSAFLPNTIIKAKKDMEIGKPISVQIQLFDSNGMVLTEDTSNVLLDVSNDAGFILNIPALLEAGVNTKSSDSTYKAIFDPSKPGTYDLRVSVCGLQSSTKFQVNVLEKNSLENGNTSKSIKTLEELDCKELEDNYLKCAICHLEFHSKNHLPRMLPCLHEAGDSCLKTNIDNTSLICPKCESVHELKNKTIDDFPINRNSTQLKDFLIAKGIDKEVERRCCDGKKRTKYWCIECSSFMCEDCKNIHSRVTATSYHNLLSIDEKEIQLESLKEFKHKTTCQEPDHEYQHLPLFCVKCRKPLCPTCEFSHRDKFDHKEHTKPIKAVYEERERGTKQNIANLKENIESAERAIQNFQKEEMKLQVAARETDKDIEEEFERLHQLLESEKNKLKNELQTIKSRKQESICKIIHNLELYRTNVFESCNRCNLALLCKNTPAFLFIEEILNGRLENLYSVKCEESHKGLGNLHFKSSLSIEECKQFMSNIGQIQESHITKESTDLDITVPREAIQRKKVIISISRPDENVQRTAKVDSITVSVLDPVGTIVDLSQNVRTDGKIAVTVAKWVPENIGLHVIKASVGCSVSTTKTVNVVAMKEIADDEERAYRRYQKAQLFNWLKKKRTKKAPDSGNEFTNSKVNYELPKNIEIDATSTEVISPVESTEDSGNEFANSVVNYELHRNVEKDPTSTNLISPTESTEDAGNESANSIVNYELPQNIEIDATSTNLISPTESTEDAGNEFSNSIVNYELPPNRDTDDTSTNLIPSPESTNDLTTSAVWRVLLLGDSFVGKSSLLSRFINNTFSPVYTKSTEVACFTRTHSVREQFVQVQILDYHGSRIYPAIIKLYHRISTGGAMIVFDLTKRKSFQNVPRWIKYLNDYANKKVPTILVGNKSDSHDGRVIDEEEVRQLADTNGMHYIETSALDSTNVVEAFQLLDNIIKDYEDKEPAT